jgi:predicted HicB family RNase H-like nuclease
MSRGDEPTHPMPFVVLSTRISPELRRRAKRWSAETGASIQSIVEAALRDYLDAQGAPH